MWLGESGNYEKKEGDKGTLRGAGGKGNLMFDLGVGGKGEGGRERGKESAHMRTRSDRSRGGSGEEERERGRQGERMRARIGFGRGGGGHRGRDDGYGQDFREESGRGARETRGTRGEEGERALRLKQNLLWSLPTTIRMLRADAKDSRLG